MWKGCVEFTCKNTGVITQRTEKFIFLVYKNRVSMKLLFVAKTSCSSITDNPYTSPYNELYGAECVDRNWQYLSQSNAPDNLTQTQFILPHLPPPQACPIHKFSSLISISYINELKQNKGRRKQDRQFKDSYANKGTTHCTASLHNVQYHYTLYSITTQCTLSLHTAKHHCTL